MVTLINKANPEMKLILPQVCIGEFHYIFDLPQAYRAANTYLNKTEWDMIEN